MIRVAIADDSPFTCRLLASYIEESGDCQVVGMAHDARETLNLVRTSSPDVLTLDLQMPGGSGLDLLRRLGDGPPVAIVVVSGVTKAAAATTLHALDLGAVDFVLKFTPGAPVSRASLKREILSKVKTAAAARPGLRRAIVPSGALPTVRGLAPPRRLTPKLASGSGAVIIGASTGGPRAVRDLLAQLPAEFATPCVIVQHLPPLFTAQFAAQLERHAHLQVREASPGDRLKPGRVLVAPGALHLLLRPDGAIDLQPVGAGDMYRPSIDRTMSSAADSFGPAAVGVVLSGMGDDGAEGLNRIRIQGGEAYVQEPASCVVASMPERALECAGADYVAFPDRIGQLLVARGKA